MSRERDVREKQRAEHNEQKEIESLKRVFEQLDANDSDTYKLYSQVMKWADKHRKLGVRTNADSPRQAVAAIAYGAEGIGLCRTEHMFFEGDRITFMRQMIPHHQNAVNMVSYFFDCRWCGWAFSGNRAAKKRAYP